MVPGASATGRRQSSRDKPTSSRERLENSSPPFQGGWLQSSQGGYVRFALTPAAGRVLSERPAPAPILLTLSGLPLGHRVSLRLYRPGRIGSVTGQSATRPRLADSSNRV